MDALARTELTQTLQHRRATLLKQFFDVEADLRSIAEDREPELEERAQMAWAARILTSLDDRSLSEIAEVHGALQRLIDGTYGTCLACRRAVPLERLRAVPTAAYCVACAGDEKVPPA